MPEIRCSRCDGTGKVTMGKHRRVETVDCPACEGKGVIVIDEPEDAA